MEKENKNGGGTGVANPPQQGPIVEITVDTIPRTIHRGRQTVAEIKTAGKVPLAYDLEEVVDNKMVPLAVIGQIKTSHLWALQNQPV